MEKISFQRSVSVELDDLVGIDELFQDIEAKTANASSSIKPHSQNIQ